MIITSVKSIRHPDKSISWTNLASIAVSASGVIYNPSAGKRFVLCGINFHAGSVTGTPVVELLDGIKSLVVIELQPSTNNQNFVFSPYILESDTIDNDLSALVSGTGGPMVMIPYGFEV